MIPPGTSHNDLCGDREAKASLTGQGEMIERVAMALQRYQTVFGPDYTGLARAAIEAGREPTEAMKSAGAISYFDEVGDRAGVDREHAGIVWRNMIDAALTRQVAQQPIAAPERA